MKPQLIFLTSLSIIASCQLYAQVHPQRGTTVADRLISWCKSSRTTVDSAFYKYNNFERGSSLDNNVLSSYTEHGYTPYDKGQRPYPMDISKLEPSTKFDSAYFQVVQNNVLKSYSSVNRIYSGNKLIVEEGKGANISNGTTRIGSIRSTFTYGLDGKLSSGMLSYDSSAALTGMFVPSYATFFRYRGNDLIKDSAADYANNHPASETNSYTYNANGNIATSIHRLNFGQGLENDTRDYYYYTNNKLTSRFGQASPDGYSWQSSQVDTFGYQGNNLTYQSQYSWNNSTRTWENSYITRWYYNSQNNLDSQLFSEVDAGGERQISRTLYSYNGYNHFTQILTFNYNGNGYNTLPNEKLDLYYEYYTPTSITKINRSAELVTLYPNPVKDVLFLRPKDKNAGIMSIHIFNTSGQLVETFTLPKSDLVQLPVSALPLGNYLLELSDKSSKQTIKFQKL